MPVSQTPSPFQKFVSDLQQFASGTHSGLIANTLSNIFTMRLIGNKTHGDMAEIGMTEFINQFLPGYEAKHVGKNLFRAKSSEEDVLVTRLADSTQIKVSLKAYGEGPLQLSTDKDAQLFPLLESLGTPRLDNEKKIRQLLDGPEFSHLNDLSVLPLIYREKEKKCAIMVFDIAALAERTSVVERVPPGTKRRKHPVWQFLDSDGDYICEVRYGGKSANALQRGLWTNSAKAVQHFRFITDGWVAYEHNMTLIDLFAKSLVSTAKAHKRALEPIDKELLELRREVNPKE